jgi:ribosomal protein S18 acetylase RimI-like enzyme
MPGPDRCGLNAARVRRAHRRSEGELIRFQENLDGVTPELLAGFWADWPAPLSPEMHLRILSGSEEIVLAIDSDAGDRVVGFLTAVGDGVFASYIPLQLVLPEYRGRGIGSELVARLLRRLADRYMVDLVCDEELFPFYGRFGMVPYGTMILRRHEVLRP